MSSELYQVLDLDIVDRQTEGEVTSAYRRLALAIHPDEKSADASVKDGVQRLVDAYERVLPDAKSSTQAINQVFDSTPSTSRTAWAWEGDRPPKQAYELDPSYRSPPPPVLEAII